ncbi:hypothetical protein PUN28_000134 [Cardiocondyla obscurior]|uniref:Uncharacterized protein n=1 Tax=Cardiocondyla obscurior TaxID=286306 RepID=A0AAW2GXX4_9HYME
MARTIDPLIGIAGRQTRIEFSRVRQSSPPPPPGVIFGRERQGNEKEKREHRDSAPFTEKSVAQKRGITRCDKGGKKKKVNRRGNETFGVSNRSYPELRAIAR